MVETTTLRRALTQEELDAQQATELPDREALSLVFGPGPAHLLPAVHAAAQTATAGSADDVATAAAPEA